MEPRPYYLNCSMGFCYMPNADINVPAFLNRMSSNWNMLSYSTDKIEKKKWRAFKNSSLIIQHVKKAFNTSA